MNEQDRADYVARYHARLSEHGHSPLTLGWGDHPGREDLRFSVALGVAREVDATSILDVGCGFGDLKRYLDRAGWEGSYVGIDIVPGLIDAAREADPGIDVRLVDLESFNVPRMPFFDMVVASGVFNHRLVGEPNDRYISEGLSRIFALARNAAVADFMTTRVDFEAQGAWHTDPCWIVSEAMRHTGRFKLMHDYLPHEFCIVMYRDI